MRRLLTKPSSGLEKKTEDKEGFAPVASLNQTQLECVRLYCRDKIDGKVETRSVEVADVMRKDFCSRVWNNDTGAGFQLQGCLVCSRNEKDLG